MRSLSSAAREIAPWGLAVALIVFLAQRIRLEDLANAARQGPVLWLLAYSILHVGLGLMADAVATRVGLAALGHDLPAREVLWARGATYFVGILNYALGQSALAVHLVRRGALAARAAGVALTLMLHSFLGLAVLVLSSGLVLAPLSPQQRRAVAVLTVGPILGAAMVYFLRPQWLVRRSLLGPFFETPARAHVGAVAFRSGYFVFQALLHWGALRIWGIHLPLAMAVVLAPLVLLAASVPVTPGGLGAVQVVQVLLFSRYAGTSSPAEAEAAVLACGLVQFSGGFAAQAVLGYACFLRWQREYHENREPAATAGSQSE